MPASSWARGSAGSMIAAALLLPSRRAAIAGIVRGFVINAIRSAGAIAIKEQFPLQKAERSKTCSFRCSVIDNPISLGAPLRQCWESQCRAES
ncbi:hypothetical protein [Brucella sp.]|uniref:hypothetical protein n=1 Tax=Brucella sp. TaxID=52132 RepID=UPI002896BA7C|nr:hypothetical protein [Brucella sp.]